MHQAQVFLIQRVYAGASGAQITSRAVTSSEATSLAGCLRNDAFGYVYSAVISLSEAIRGLQKSLPSWATVKLYYSTFYAARGLLVLDGRCIFYVGSRPYSLLCRTGEVCARRNGQTHKIVIDLFRANCSAPFFLSQPIGLEDGFLWLMRLREDANYRLARFQDPTMPQHFFEADRIHWRRALQVYLDPTQQILIFDPDHAALAFPLAFVATAVSRCKQSGIWNLSRSEKTLLRGLLADSSGPIAPLHAALL